MSDLNLTLDATTLEDLLGDLTNAELLVVARKANVALGAISEAGLDKVIEAVVAVTWVKAKRDNPEATWDDALESRTVTDFIRRAMTGQPTDEPEDVDPS